jgi:glycosyltransferase involved in cell wall biosynthesis
VSFWQDMGADLAIVVTWHRMSAELEVLNRAGVKAVALSDTDGRVGFRPFSGFSFVLALNEHNALLDRAQAALRWALERAKASLRGSWEEREALLSTERSSKVAIGHDQGVENFRRFLRYHGAGHLIDRVVEVPFTIGDSFFRCSLPEQKQERIAAIGRWDAWQKNAPLLARALIVLGRERPGMETHIFGRGAQEQFEGLQTSCPGLVIRGEVEQAEVAECLATCRSIVFSSRWEGCPHAALEALALGATVVGTPIPSLRSWAENGRFGTIARRPRPSHLARAVLREMEQWDQGRRDPLAISEHWRARLDPRAVCQALLASR